MPAPLYSFLRSKPVPADFQAAASASTSAFTSSEPALLQATGKLTAALQRQNEQLDGLLVALSKREASEHVSKAAAADAPSVLSEEHIEHIAEAVAARLRAPLELVSSKLDQVLLDATAATEAKLDHMDRSLTLVSQQLHAMLVNIQPLPAAGQPFAAMPPNRRPTSAPPPLCPAVEDDEETQPESEDAQPPSAQALRSNAAAAFRFTMRGRPLLHQHQPAALSRRAQLTLPPSAMPVLSAGPVSKRRRIVQPGE